MSSFEFDQLVLKNADFLKPVAISLTRDQETAKDLFQETMYRAWANQKKYASGTNIRAWLYTIMRNVFINDYRRKSREQIIIDTSANQFLLDHKQAAIGNPAERNLHLKEIQFAIHQLPGIFKIPFLFYFSGYKYHEIANLLNEPLGTIKSRIHFARKLLKEQINRF